MPDGFVFAMKGPRFATNRRALTEASDSIKRFYESGVLELGNHLGPVLWQFAPTKNSTKQTLANFLSRCHANRRGARCATWSRYATLVFACPTSSRCYESSQRPWCSLSMEATRQLQILPAISCMHDCRREMTISGPAIRRTNSTPGPGVCNCGPVGTNPTICRASILQKQKVPRDVFVHVIHEGKGRAPAGAMELIERVK